MNTFLAVLGVLLVITDYAIKVLAIGVLPSNRKPSSAMAWLILILIIPFAGFIDLPVPGPNQRGRQAARPPARGQRRRSAAATDRLPVTPVAGPVYLGSVATLNRELGSLPLQDGNLVELIPGYGDAIDGR